MRHDLVSQQDIIDSKRCKKIINKRTGCEFPRREDPNSRWELTYYNAKIHPQEFELEFDRDKTQAEEVYGRILERKELESFSMDRVREVGLQFRVTSNSKKVLIDKILDEQKKAIKQSLEE
jgi:hypothetical protein